MKSWRYPVRCASSRPYLPHRPTYVSRRGVDSSHAAPSCLVSSTLSNWQNIGSHATLEHSSYGSVSNPRKSSSTVPAWVSIMDWISSNYVWLRTPLVSSLIQLRWLRRMSCMRLEVDIPAQAAAQTQRQNFQGFQQLQSQCRSCVKSWRR